MDLYNLQEEGIKIKPNPNAPKKKNRKNNTPRSRSASPKKNKNRNERAAHNSAGHKPGVKIQPPSMGVMDGIYSDDDSPTRNTDHNPNQESDNSHFSQGYDGSNTSINSNKSDPAKKARDKAEKKRQQKNKPADSQRKNDASECINLEEDDEIDNCSTQGCFDGIPTDRICDPKQQERVKKLKDKFGEDDDSYTKAVERSKKHRGNRHGESSLAAQSLSNSNNPTRMLTKDRKKHQHKGSFGSYGRANLERGGGRVMPSYSDDPLDVATSQQRTNRGSSSRDMVAPKLKNGNGRKKQHVSITSTQQKPWGEGDMLSKRVKQREELAAAALKRKTQNDDRSGNNSSGEKRKRSSFGQQDQNDAIDVDDDDNIMGTLAAASNQRFEDKPKKVVALPPLGIGRRTDGRVGEAAEKEKKTKKKSPISNVDAHLKNTKRRDDIVESESEVMSKRIPKKKSMKNKLKSQGGRFDFKEDKYEQKDGEWLSRMTEPAKRTNKKKGKQQTQATTTTRRKTRSSSSGRGSKKNEVITIDSSSDEGEDSSASESAAEQHERSKRAFGDVASIDAVRIGVGKKVFRSKCKLSFQFGTNNPYIEFSYENKKGKMTEHTVYLKGDELTEVKYHIPDENDTSEDGADSDSMTIIAFRINPSETNGFDKYSSAYSQENDEDPEKFHKRYISVEVRDTDDFRAMLDQMNEHRDLSMWCSKDSEIEFWDLERYTKALTDDEQKERKERMSTRVTRSGGRKKKRDSENKLLVVYPFGVDEEVLSEAASGLKELGGDSLGVEEAVEDKTNQQADVEMQDSSEIEDVKGKSSRMHYVTIRDEDIERLCPGQFLNDTLVDFFMRWISRGESNNPDSDVHFFTSHFMTTLKDEGPKAVSSWTAKKNINIFKKKFVFIPVNADLHWSLCVVVNAGLIANWYNENNNVPDTEEHSCILFLDSLKMHSKNMYAKHIRKWLNFEWKRLGKGKVGGNIEPFYPKSMPSLSPKIPYQANGCDCGVFVCRYAYNLFLMKHLKFTWNDMKKQLKTLITKSPAFRFGMSDVARMRDEMERLINNLSKIYLAIKEREKADKKKKKSKLPVKTEEDKKSSLPVESTSAVENNDSTAAESEKKKDGTSDESMEDVGGGDRDEHMDDANEKDTSRDSMDTDEGGGVSESLLSSEDESPAAAKGDEDVQESTSEEKENVVKEGSSQKSADDEDETLPDAPSTSDGDEVDASISAVTSPLV